MRITALSALVPLLLAIAVATPLTAQDRATLPPATGVINTGAVHGTQPLVGPRLAPAFQSFQPRLVAADSADARMMAADGNHTIVVSTLVLVLAAIIVVLLVVN